LWAALIACWRLALGSPFLLTGLSGLSDLARPSGLASYWIGLLAFIELEPGAHLDGSVWVDWAFLGWLCAPARADALAEMPWLGRRI